MKRLIIFILLSLFLSTYFGCAPQRRANNKLKRAARLIDQAKRLDLGASIIDTIKVRDTVYIQAVKHDTSFIDIGDTVTIEKDRLKIKYFRDTVTNLVTIEGECKADTVIREIKVPYEVMVYEKSWLEKLGIKWKWWYWLILVIIAGIFIYKRL